MGEFENARAFKVLSQGVDPSEAVGAEPITLFNGDGTLFVDGSPAPIVGFKLDDILTLEPGFYFPTAAGSSGYDNDPSCYIVGNELVVSGDVFRTANAAAAKGTNLRVGFLNVGSRPPVRYTFYGQFFALADQFPKIAVTIDSDGEVFLRFYEDAPTAAPNAYLYLVCRIPLAVV